MWEVELYEKQDGTVPVQIFLDALPKKLRVKAARDISTLERLGTGLTAPYVGHIDGKLWELRTIFSGDISRIFYFLHTGRKFILLHGFIKKTQQTPPREIERARQYMNDYLRRNNS